MPTSAEAMLISSVMRNSNMRLAVTAGVQPEMFHDYPEEWEWLDSYYKRHRRTPSRAAFLNRFEDFRLKQLNDDDTEYFAEEVRKKHAKHLLLVCMKDMGKLIAQGQIEAASSLAQASVVTVSAAMGTSNDEDVIQNFEAVLEEARVRLSRVEETGSAGIPTGMGTLDSRVGGVQPGDFWVVGARMGHGKALDDEEPVLTPGGWVRNGDLRVGDHVTGSDGRPTEVIAVHPQGQKQVYEVRFSDHTTIRTCEDHLWTTRVGFHPWKVQTTAQVAKWLDNSPLRPCVPVLSGPVSFDGRRFPESRSGNLYAPYNLGLLLGDGCFRGKMVSFTTADAELVKPFGRNARQWNGAYAYGIGRLKDTIEALGLWGLKSEDKFIPRKYQTAEPRHRLALLQGLMDTDGTVTNAGTASFSSSSLQLALDTKELIEGLGGVVKMRTKKTTHLDSHQLTFALPQCPFRLKRKVVLWKQRTKYPITRQIVSVTPLNEWVPMTCITVSNPDSLYVVRNGVVTHNSWVLQSWAANAAAKGYVVQFDALEQSIAQATFRIHAFLASSTGQQVFKTTSLMQGKDFDIVEYKRFLRKLRKDINGRLHVWDSRRGGRLGLSTLSAQIERNQPDLVLIDYITLMDKKGAEWQDVAALSNGLKAVGMSYQCGLVSAAQLNRERGLSKMEPPGPEAIAQSDTIGQDADVVITQQQPSPHVLVHKAVKVRNARGMFKFYSHLDPDNGILKEVTFEKAMDIMDDDKDEDYE